jgi:tripartite-type tricarboxylate transporter receptor subunit TctC
MHKNIARIARNLTGLILGAGISTACLAQSWPGKTVTVVVPWPPGGPSDTAARPLAKSMSESLGQTFVVDNKGGAGGNIGTAQVAKAAPDGYTHRHQPPSL